MRKMINSISGVQKLSKGSQREIKGGMPEPDDCISGCYRFYIADSGSNACVVPSPSGASCFGTVQNGQCCI